MDFDYRVLLAAMAMSFVVGMAIFLLWRLFEPKREGESRSLMDSVVKPAAVLAGGVLFIGIFMIFPSVLRWTIGALAIFVAIVFFRMPAKEKRAMSEALNQTDPESDRSISRFFLAVAIVFAAIIGFLAYFATD